MSKHSCFECKWCHYLLDSSNRNVEICVFDQSENYLQEVLLGQTIASLTDTPKSYGKKKMGGNRYG